ncbi:hypothetical protein HKCCE3408_15145 [Rhodobacterales bacterium HKCCE3408]|nr:hypothetical protein [Rhodobacterales bacterium HKCCE3408]
MLTRANKRSHHGWASALAGEDPAVSPATATTIAAGWVRDALANNIDLFVSAESMYRHTASEEGGPSTREGYVRRLARTFEPLSVDVVPILVFRHPVDFIESLYKEMVMVTPDPSFSDFAEFRQQILRRRHGHLGYHANASILKSNFPKLKCAIFEDLRSGGSLETRFFDLMGIDVSGLESFGRSREGTTPLATQLKQLANTWGFDPAKNWKVFDWIRSGETIASAEKIIGTGPFHLWRDDAERAAFVSEMSGQIENLRKDFFPEKSELFAAPGPLVGQPVPEFPRSLKDWLRADGIAKGLIDA